MCSSDRDGHSVTLIVHQSVTGSIKGIIARSLSRIRPNCGPTCGMAIGIKAIPHKQQGLQQHPTTRSLLFSSHQLISHGSQALRKPLLDLHTTSDHHPVREAGAIRTRPRRLLQRRTQDRRVQRPAPSLWTGSRSRESTTSSMIDTLFSTLACRTMMASSSTKVELSLGTSLPSMPTKVPPSSRPTFKDKRASCKHSPLR